MRMVERLGGLNSFARRRFGHIPTPLEPAPNLSRRVGGAQLWLKRDDCTGLAFGGNKVRQLEFYIGAAEAEGADTVLITGAVQSNFVRLAAACARQAGMDIHIQLEERVARDDALYRQSGNVLIDRLLGATLHRYPAGEDEAGADANLATIADGLRAEGRRPYVIHLAPGHPPLGALGYVVAARELIGQAADLGQRFDAIVTASGSGATHAGLLFGLRALGDATPVLGVCVRRDAGVQRDRIIGRCAEIAGLLETANPVAPGDVRLDESHLAPGYGLAGEATRDAVLLAARTEALMLDPVYTGKSMAGAMDEARRRGAAQSVLFLHTGGTPALFAYGAQLLDD